MTVTICRFKRKENSKPEFGIAVGEVDVIVDKNGKVVPVPVWEYKLWWELGTLNVDLDKDAK